MSPVRRTSRPSCVNESLLQFEDLELLEIGSNVSPKRSTRFKTKWQLPTMADSEAADPEKAPLLPKAEAMGAGLLNAKGMRGQ